MIDWTKPVRTKVDHIPVTILTTKGRGVRPVIGYLDRQAVSTAPENDVPSTWAPDGMHYLPWMELENVPPPPVTAKRWIVWREYFDGKVTCSIEKDEAYMDRSIEQASPRDGIAPIVTIQEINYTQGELKHDASSSK